MIVLNRDSKFNDLSLDEKEMYLSKERILILDILENNSRKLAEVRGLLAARPKSYVRKRPDEKKLKK